MKAELPKVITVSNSKSGPTIAILGGVHGDEFEGVLAARQILSHVNKFLLKGQVKFVAPAHPVAWKASTRESPIDGLNLARVFPGVANGRPTEAVAHHITENLIAGSDLVIDLHSAGKNFDMALLCGYQDSGNKLCIESERYAQIFQAPYTWRHGGPATTGRSLSVAAELNIPSIYVEGRGGAQVRSGDLDCYVSGVKRILHSLGMLESSPAATSAPICVEGDGDTDTGITAPVSGYFTTQVSVGDQVEIGDLLGEILDLEATPIAEIRAQRAGVAMLVRRLSPVSADDTLAIIAAIEQG